MTTAEIILLISEIAMIAIIELQIFMLNKDLKRETIMRRSSMRFFRKHLTELWEDIRATGIKGFKSEDINNDHER